MTIQRKTLFPEIEAYDDGYLKVSDLHTIHYEQCGNPQGKPVVFLHGGPGGGIVPDYRRFFDPAFYRVVLFDQRGCGKSTPHAELRENDTWNLVEDIERLRRHLNIERWLVFGGSWGSTLGLSYAVRHPQSVVGLILRGIFLCRPYELKWFYQEGTSNLFADAWEGFLQPIPQAERTDLMAAYYRRLTGADQQVRLEAARAWSKWEAFTSKLIPDPADVEEFDDPQLAVAFASIECHYFVNRAFMPTENYLLEQAPSIQHIPCRLVQGRYDVICPMRNAWELKKAMPGAELRIVPDAGHSAMEPGIVHELIQATEDFKKLFV
jgi:proline iminopeptidase